MKKPLSLLLSILISCLFLLPCPASAAAEPVGYARLAEDCAEGIVSYKKTSLGVLPEEPLFAGDFLNAAGSTAGDWYPFGMAASGIADDYAAYLAALRENVRTRYAEDGTLSPSKATEWHRIILAALACGADPTRFCLSPDGEPVDLLADGVFYRENVGRQGVNGYIWALIALNTRDYAVPEGAVNTKETLLAALTEKQTASGGWAAAGDAADADLTAMALIALAPLTKENGTAAAAAAKAVECLASLQDADAGFTNGGLANCESCAVTVTALCCLGIDPATDERFMKNGRSVLDALLAYRLPDGSFTHAFTADPENPSAVPTQPNDMSCQQALYALAALSRLYTDGGSIFDFRGKPLSDAGWDTLPAAPSAVEKTARNLFGRLAAYFTDEKNRKTAVSAALAVAVLAGALVLVLRAKRHKRK